MGQPHSKGWTGMSEEQPNPDTMEGDSSNKEEVDPRSPSQAFRRTPIRFFWKSGGTPHRRLQTEVEDPRSPNPSFQRTPIHVDREERRSSGDVVVQKLFGEEGKTVAKSPLSVRN